MTTEEFLKPLNGLVEEWPLGATVWHRANGQRAVIIGYAIIHGAGLKIVVDYGGGPQPENPLVMRSTKPGDGTEGEEWKDEVGA